MSWVSSEVVSVLTFLLPGFVAAGVFYTFTSHPKPNEFERIVQALIFTILAQAVVGALQFALLWAGKYFGAVAPWTKTGEVVLSVSVAIVLGLMTVRMVNNDTLHGLLRRLKFTKENSYPSEWYSAFSRHPNSYVVLHLTGERRLYGWPEEWPNRPDQGHFSIAQGEWPVGEERIPLDDVSAIVVPASNVEMVEFVPISSTNQSTE